MVSKSRLDRQILSCFHHFLYLQVRTEHAVQSESQIAASKGHRDVNEPIFMICTLCEMGHY